jgi:hypothetical protein
VTWLQLDDRILEHPKFVRAVKRAGADAIFMWLGLRAYCAQNLTDGEVPLDMLDEVRGPPAGAARDSAVRALLEVGLLENGGGALRLHDYLDWSESRAVVMDRRAKNRERKQMSRRDSARTPPVVTVGVTPPTPLPSPPLPSPPDPVNSSSQIQPTNKGQDTAVFVRGGRAPKQKVGRWRRVPPDWEVKPQHRTMALGLLVDVAIEEAAFRDHEFFRPKLDADATFRNWIREAAKRPRPRGLSGAHTNPLVERARRIAEAEKKGAAE